ncbi:MAG TPA: HEAT repeat domain-containing protein, partial [Candidatus Sulfotelmatobacter sp.]|nr:HEAT repeat domain-containing protein [Candidatus Sulfotelmatobacter sp.]
AMATLLNCLAEADSRVRLAAAQVLEKWGDPAHAPWFLSLLNDASFEVRLTAIQFVRRLGDPLVAEALLPLLEDWDSDVRLATAQALGAIRNPVAVEALVVALTDEERTVREAAGAALQHINPQWMCLEAAQHASHRLQCLLQDPRAWVSSAAAQVLSRIHAASGTVVPSGWPQGT